MRKGGWRDGWMKSNTSLEKASTTNAKFPTWGCNVSRIGNAVIIDMRHVLARTPSSAEGYNRIGSVSEGCQWLHNPGLSGWLWKLPLGMPLRKSHDRCVDDLST